jgi:hypothetical protein
MNQRKVGFPSPFSARDCRMIASRKRADGRSRVERVLPTGIDEGVIDWEIADSEEEEEEGEEAREAVEDRCATVEIIVAIEH